MWSTAIPAITKPLHIYAVTTTAISLRLRPRNFCKGNNGPAASTKVPYSRCKCVCVWWGVRLFWCLTRTDTHTYTCTRVVCVLCSCEEVRMHFCVRSNTGRQTMSTVSLRRVCTPSACVGMIGTSISLLSPQSTSPARHKNSLFWVGRTPFMVWRFTALTQSAKSLAATCKCSLSSLWACWKTVKA